jgi:hypothetical protein
MGGKPTYPMQQPRKEKFSPSKRFTAHNFLEGIATTGEGQNLRDDKAIYCCFDCETA